MDIVGLENYNVYYMIQTTKKKDTMLVCLTLKQTQQDPVLSSERRLVFTGCVYITGDMLGDDMIELIRNEGLKCVHGFPSAQSVTSITAVNTNGNDCSVHTACKLKLDAMSFKSALRSFINEETGELVCDVWKTQGNGIGFRSLHNDVGCVGLLYLLRDNVMLMEQPLMGHSVSHSNLIGMDDIIYVLDLRIVQTFIGVATQGGIVNLQCGGNTGSGIQRGCLSYIVNDKETHADSCFTATFSMALLHA